MCSHFPSLSCWKRQMEKITNKNIKMDVFSILTEDGPFVFVHIGWVFLVKQSSTEL